MSQPNTNPCTYKGNRTDQWETLRKRNGKRLLWFSEVVVVIVVVVLAVVVVVVVVVVAVV